VRCAGSLRKRGEKEIRREGEGEKNEGSKTQEGMRKIGTEIITYI
jgi:hypothetical protein